nr:type I polyketide synthase [Kibdelosporangium sp. MJ126-NF4]CEL18267.1 modular polyketide synthase [Kibdelosporangium sp. MJ126-NF4]CTQ97753.1 modular polyketide synthase [Kibdelosporangium sp. MJ126-NF4]
MSALSYRDLVIGVSPLAEPNAALVVAVERAGGLGVLDLGRDRVAAMAELELVRRRLGTPFGVRLGPDCPIRPDELPDEVDVVLTRQPFAGGDRSVLVEVTSLAEAHAAVERGADGLIARGCESGGRVGELTTFVLLQRLVTEFDVPIWAAGGIGPITAAAAVAGGARGVVLDSQFALVSEVRDCLDAELAAAVERTDGADTTIVDGRRVLTLPGAGYPVEIGQDGALASDLWRSYRTAGGVVQAIGKTVRANLESAARNPALRPGGIFCERAAGLRYPLAQGPMTRVSDQPAFAEAVAAAGGLPFLALSLMNGEQTRSLLTRTAALLGDRPWGIGILGFADPELRQAQLAEVLAVKPRYAIVAGGNPAQAKALDDAGIEAFLHVPSPALLRNFLDDGARRFVFEGWECGGHTGPRSSFTLWEQQISVLLGRASLADVSVLFAGGIHDERSAAMVSAMSASLTDRGAAVGALMGTAYLFTREAVEHGAISPVFQQVAVDCEETALLETSPGHSVRCAQSSFVDVFEQARAELADAPRQEAWERLEQLNLGRLRIASRALKRDGADLVAVGADEQRDTGMFMIGQVATLRSGLTDIATLHEQVTSTRLLRDRNAELAREPKPEDVRPLDVAIVGMAAMLPGAGDVAQFWANVVSGVDAIREVPADRWNPDLYAGATPSRWGGFLDPVPFDPLAYGLPPASLTSIEPAQLLALEAAARALADAGYRTRQFDRDRTSVIYGAEAGADLANAYTVRSALPALFGGTPDGLDEFLPKLTEDSFPGVLGNVIAGRIANRLDLGGANYTVDAACASSLAALDVACKELRAGTSDMVLCGAVDLHNSAHDYLMFASVQALSPSGRCATFDSAADGIALGEGVACVVLKRLADAERDGDRIYAVIKGIGASSDGKSLGLTAPRADGQRRALQRAYGSAGVSMKEVGLVEAHGTGTVVGDRTELAALTEMFTESGADTGSCVIGSVKSQIGHTKCTAGLAGLIKAATAVHTGVRPGTLHVTKPNTYYDQDNSPFAFGHRTWSVPAELRTAGVSAFGFGGTNFHTVITGYGGVDEPRHGLREWPAELVVFRGTDQAAARRAADRVARLVRANDEAGRPHGLRDLAATAAAIAPGQPIQAVAVVADFEQLSAAVADVQAWRASDTVRLRGEEDAPTVAFLYPGQGSQRPGMLLDLFTAFPRLQETLRLAGGRYENVMFPPSATTPGDAERQKAAITDTTVAQPALGIAGLAVTRLLDWLGIRPDMAGGHSYGELVALTAAGVFEPEQLLELSEARAKAIVSAVGIDPGMMAAVSGSIDDVRALVPDNVVVANHNSPTQVVISGGTEAIADAVRRMSEAGLSARAIPVAAAFHSPLVARAEDTFADVLAAQELNDPAFPVWSNVDAKPHGDVRATLARQVAAEVRFVDQIEAMYAAGARVFVEAGPGTVLTGLVGRILGDRPHTAVACDAPGRAGIPTFLHALAGLAVAGVPVNVAPLFTGRAEPVRLEEIPARPNWFVDGGLVRDVNGKALGGGLRPATELPQVTFTQTGATAPNRDVIVKEFLDGMREAVAAQRDVLLGYLGTAPAAPALAPLPAPQPVVVAVEPEPDIERPVLDVGTVVLETISARTGYPPEMLEPGLDLEADLSIDSIKRTEIIGELATALGMTGDGSAVEALTGIKTIEGIVGWFAQAETTHAGTAPVQTTAPAEKVAVEGGKPVRQVPIVVGIDACIEPVSLAGQRVLIIDDGGDVGLELADRIERLGGTVHAVGRVTTTDADYVVYLSALRSTGEPTLPEAYAEIRASLLSGIKGLIVATAGGGTFGFEPEDGHEPLDLGMHGLIRTAAVEYPHSRIRAVDVSTKESHRLIAAALLAELTTVDGPAVVGHASGQRYAIGLDAVELDGDGQLDLNQDSVVLLTGGARGITALAAIELAERTGCRIELIGRTAPPKGPEDARTVSATTEADLRRALIETGLDDREEITATTRRILAEREVRTTMDSLRSSAASVRYHACDVQDTEAVHAVIGDIVGRFGRIDGVVHGAGVLEDKLLAEKSPEAFARVYNTKVGGARALAAALRHNPKFVVLFGSISGVLGNRGQADYSAANDTLDRIARLWATQTSARVVSVDWGPWAGSGMAAGLADEYARRGIQLIDPRAGVTALLREIAVGDAVQVVYQCAQ